MDQARSEFAPGFVAIRDDIITGVGPQRDCPEEAGRVIDAAGKIALPGFVNAHTHAIHILMRGGLLPASRRRAAGTTAGLVNFMM
jgi:cytosine/adenosine deaminase-related metal-dependent hydrolase